MRRVGILVLVLLFCGLVLFGTACSDNGDDDGGGPTVYTLEIIADQDASVLEELPDNNYGTDDTVEMGDYGGVKSWGYFQFDVSSVPAGASIQSVELHLYVTNSSTALGSDFTFELCEVIANWSEDTITWNNKPDVSTTMTFVGPSNGYTGWHIISGSAFKVLVEAWVNDPTYNRGIAIRPSFTGGGVNETFDCVSIDNALSDYHPKLIIQYTLP